jgi:hypothetical protein
VRNRIHAVALVEVRAALEDEDEPGAAVDGENPPFVARDRGGGEAGQLRRGDVEGGLAQPLRGLLPARAEDDGDVERVDAGAVPELVGGFLRDGERVVGHGASLLLPR